MGRYKTYKTAAALWKAVEGYFLSISRKDKVMEPHDTGELDRYGHKIYEQIPALNAAGQEILRTVYLVPPTVGGLLDHLKISSSTWSRYCDADEHPEFAEVTEWARDRFVNWRFDELIVRPDKFTKGLMHDLEVNYKIAAKKPVEVTILGGDLKGMDELELQALAAKMARRGEDVSHPE